jgi:predicted GIY-YIG superfamily endonuclease
VKNRTLKRLPPACEMPHCVYFLCLKSEVVYIGASRRVLARSTTHKNEGIKFDEVYYFECESSTEAFSEETRLIKKYLPIRNSELHDGHRAVTTDSFHCGVVDIEIPRSLHKEAAKWAAELGLRDGLSGLVSRLLRREINTLGAHRVPLISELLVEEFGAS